MMQLLLTFGKGISVAEKNALHANLTNSNYNGNRLI